MMPWFYLSFADGRLPKGQQWLGAAIVEGTDPRGAIKRAWRLRINPGGEVAFTEIEHLPPERFRNRLLISKSELRDMGKAIDSDTSLIDLNRNIVKPDGAEDDP
jgi:hypothetical protein